MEAKLIRRPALFSNNLENYFNDLFSAFDGNQWSPAVDVREDDQSVVVSVDAPGVSKDDLNIEVDGSNLLTISGERKNEREEQQGGYYRLERAFGSFQRRLQLPENIDPETIVADYNDGVLDIRIPKSNQAQQTTEIPINKGEGD